MDIAIALGKFAVVVAVGVVVACAVVVMFGDLCCTIKNRKKMKDPRDHLRQAIYDQWAKNTCQTCGETLRDCRCARDKRDEDHLRSV